MRFSIWFPLFFLSNIRQDPHHNNSAPHLVTEIFNSCYLLINSGHSHLIPFCQTHLYLIISSYPLFFSPPHHSVTFLENILGGFLSRVIYSQSPFVFQEQEENKSATSWPEYYIDQLNSMAAVSYKVLFLFRD